MIYDAIIVGSGASGLTAAAHLAQAGRSLLLLEKEPRCGGLVNSFTRNGFTFDGGIRALDNAGVLFPMLSHLGIDIEFVPNRISVGIEDQVIHVESDESLIDYQRLLTNLYPESADEISAIMADIQQIMQYMEIQYGIDNPLFLDPKIDREYFVREVFPWMIKYALNVHKVSAKDLPVVEYMKKFTQNPSLIDIITQHFFTETPAYFALSYFTLYQDYYYPKNGTGVFAQKLTEFITYRGGEIRTNMTVNGIDIERKIVTTENGQEFKYQQLLWTADQKTLYQIIDIEHLTQQKVRDAVQDKRETLADKSGNDSVLTLFLSTNLDKSYFAAISAGHFFYTPSRRGQTNAGEPPLDGDWEAIKTWLDQFFALTTYEISIPVLRDSALAPVGKTGLIISALFDYQLTKYIHDQGWDADFRDYVGALMINTLDSSIYPGLAHSVEDKSISTPLTLQKLTGSTDGAITGWSFTNHPMPTESRLVRISNAVKTPLPDVYQAGQWTYSPSGFPVALITGKLAADRIKKRLKK